MITNTTIILASDGTKMQALHYMSEKKTKRIIIHVHGMAGNFYENDFLEIVAGKCKDIGIDYLVFNNRGHDYVADCVRVTENGCEGYSGGGAYEVFSECIYDIEGVLHWADENGYEEIYLEGHSSGANKIIYAFNRMSLKKEIFSKIRGIILLSPCDDIGIYFEESTSEQRKKTLELADVYINEGTPEKLMPEGTFFDYILSAKTYRDCFVEGSHFDVFSYRNGTLENTDISMIKKPILVIFGGNGDFILQEVGEIEKMIKAVKDEVTVELLANANHSYKGSEEELAEVIVRWVGMVF